MKPICQLNAWGYSSAEWDSLTPRERSRIRGWAKERLRKDLWRICNWDKQLEYSRNWKDRNRERVRLQNRIHHRLRYAKIKAARMLQAEQRRAEREEQREIWVAETKEAMSRNPGVILSQIRRAVSANKYPVDVIDDIASDMMIGLLQGDMPLSEIKASVARYAQEHYRQRGWKKTLSLHAPRFPSGDGIETLGDRLATDGTFLR